MANDSLTADHKTRADATSELGMRFSIRANALVLAFKDDDTKNALMQAAGVTDIHDVYAAPARIDGRFILHLVAPNNTAGHDFAMKLRTEHKMPETLKYEMAWQRFSAMFGAINPDQDSRPMTDMALLLNGDLLDVSEVLQYVRFLEPKTVTRRRPGLGKPADATHLGAGKNDDTGSEAVGAGAGGGAEDGEDNGDDHLKRLHAALSLVNEYLLLVTEGGTHISEIKYTERQITMVQISAKIEPNHQ